MKFAFPMLVFALLAAPASPQAAFETDIIHTTAGNLEITFIGHGSLMMKFGSTIIHIDPYGTLADYSILPKADMILVTHDHYDHCDVTAIEKIRTKGTALVLTERGAGKLAGGIVMKNGDVQTVRGIKIEAVPAYNLVHKRDSGQPFHPKGEGNGYILTFGDTRVYIAGDTENTPELKALTGIAVAFLPMNLPYTMSPEMAADAAQSLKPGILYPYHYGDTDTSRIIALLKNNKNIEVRIRRMK